MFSHSVLAATSIEIALGAIFGLASLTGVVYTIMRFTLGGQVSKPVCEEVRKYFTDKNLAVEASLEKVVRDSTDRFNEFKVDTIERHKELRREVSQGYERVESLFAKFIEQNSKLIEQNTFLVTKLIERRDKEE